MISDRFKAILENITLHYVMFFLKIDSSTAQLYIKYLSYTAGAIHSQR